MRPPDPTAPTVVEPAEARPDATAPSPQADARTWTVTAECPGRYRFPGNDPELAEIGRGGIGRVLVAHDGHLGRDVALKELLPNNLVRSNMTIAEGHVYLSGATPALTRFLHEARITGQLEHPGVVPVYELGARPDGTVYYTMKLVRGRTLGQALQGCATFEDRVRLLPHFVSLCHAVAYAHSRGVIHRDIKPANVMLGEFGETVLLDWGLAKVRGSADIDSELPSHNVELRHSPLDRLTVEGVAVGTPEYMSPEQVRGDTAHVDAAADVWALGVVLYQLLSGTLPFGGSSPAEVMRNVLSQPLVPPQERNKAVPRELASICLRALAREPAARFPSAGELAEELEAFRAGFLVASHQYTLLERAQRLAARHRAALGAGLAVLLVVIAALAVVTASWRGERVARQREAEARASERAERLEASFRLAQGLAERAQRLTRERALLDAKVFAAASWLANPAAGGGIDAEELLARHPEAHTTVLTARSRWYQANMEAMASLVTAAETGTPLLAVALAPQGERVATGGSDAEIVLWNTQDGRRQAAMQAADEVRDLAFSPDGKRVVAATRDGQVECWDAGRGMRLWRARAEEGETSAVAYAPDGTLVLTAGRDGAIRVWHAEDGKPLGYLGSHPATVHDLATTASRRGPLVASASRDHTVRVWDLVRRELLATLTGPTAVVRGVAFGAGGTLVAAVSYDKTARVWELPSGRTRLVAGGFEDEVLSVALSTDGGRLVAGGWDGRVTLWDVQACVPLLALTHQSPVWATALGQHDHLLAAVTDDGRLRLWKLNAPRPVLAVPERTYIWSLDLSPDGSYAATAGSDGVVHLHNLATAKPPRLLRGHQDVVGAVAFSPDGRTLASSGFDGTVRLWDVASGRQIRLLAGHRGFVRSVTWSPVGTLLATAGSDKTVRVWDAANGVEILRFASRSLVRAVAFDPLGRELAAVGDAPDVMRWAIPTGTARPPLHVTGAHLSGLAYASDGHTLAAGDEAGWIVTFDPYSGRELGRRKVHVGFVYTLRFSPDGRWLVSAGDDRRVGVLRPDDLVPELLFEASQSVMAIDLATNGKLLAMGDGHLARILPLDLQVLDTPPEELLARAEAGAGLRLAGFELRPR